MRYKFDFEINNKKKTLTVVESGEVDSGLLLPLNKEEYSLEEIKKAVDAGIDIFTEKFRRRNFFHPNDYIIKFFDKLTEMFKQENQNKLSVECEDLEGLSTGRKKDSSEEEEDDIEIEDLLNEEEIEDIKEIEESESLDDSNEIITEEEDEKKK